MDSPAKPSEPDAWYGVQDSRKRKRIQDRLAQRARRKRLAEAQRESDASSSTTPSSSHNHSAVLLDMSAKAKPAGTAPVSLAHLPVNESMAIVSPTHPSKTSPLRGISIRRLLPDSRTAVIVALRLNGSILGLACGANPVSPSARPTSHVPQTLYPTPLQLATPHHTWIDGWPFRRLRDNLILLRDRVDVNELFADFARMETFSITDGSQHWNPKAWRVEPQFAAKWGYLFH